jgi:uncharacterized protein (TIGR03435 family)
VRSALLYLASAAALAQPAPSPAFEVASIRSVQPGNESIETGPASLTMRYVHLTACVRWAYGVQDVQVSGPPWLSDVWFDIFAKSANPVSVAELRAMLRTLLAERFKLAVHRDSKEMTALVLTVGKDGHKLKAVDTEGSPSFQTGRLSLTGRGATIGQMADFVASKLRIPVLDRTGLTGRYDYFLDLEPYFSEESRKAAEQNGGAPPDANAIVAVAMQKELGVKVEAKKVPVEIVVVDHVEKTPTEN